MKTNIKYLISVHLIWMIVLCLLVITAGHPVYSADQAINDEDITNAVNEKLMFNAETPSYLIDVETNNGIVTLSGTVDDLLTRDRAIKVSRSIKGVRGVIDQLEVKVPYRSDETIKKDVQDALLYDPATESYEIDIDVQLQVVTMNGTVDSWQEKQLAEHVAKGIKGVKDIKNNIDIDYKAKRIDHEIKQEVVEALRNDVRVDDGLIDVEVNNGEVTLSGTVGSSTEKFQAEADAWVAGVESVNLDNLKVEKWARDKLMRKDKYIFRSDQEVKDAVEDAYVYDPRVYSFNPEIEVSNGIVTLTGMVDNLKAKRAAEEDARNVVGVFSVKNFLKVRPVDIPDDDDLEKDVSNALLRDPYVEKYEISVKANNGVVYLKGSVDSYFEKTQAEDITAKTMGVIEIENNLQVESETGTDRYWRYYGWNSLYPAPFFDQQYSYQTDWELIENIKDQLWWSPYVNEDEVNVTAENGVVTLTGTVDTQREKLYAEINAMEGGAIDVKNKLEVDFLPED